MDAKKLSDVLAEKCPDWSTATVVLRDESGNIVGCGNMKRTGEASAAVTVSASSVARLLDASLPEVNA